MKIKVHLKIYRQILKSMSEVISNNLRYVDIGALCRTYYNVFSCNECHIEKENSVKVCETEI